MSSPLQSLNKKSHSKKFSKRTMPFRKEINNDQALLDDITQGMATESNFTRSYGGQPTNTTTDRNKNVVKSVPNNMELIETMMKRISQLEIQSQFSSKEIIKKDQIIKVLEERVFLLMKSQENGERSTTSGEFEELELKCVELQNQIFDMESFLADYGMIWVGDKSKPISFQDNDLDTISASSSVSGTWQPNISLPVFNNLQVDYDLIIKNIRDLNQIAGEGESLIKKTKDGAKLELQDSVSLTLYANGIMMFNGPFRTFDEISTQRCIGDLMDGFFPSELQKKYPDGVPIQLTDRRSVFFKDPRKKETFPGVGRSIGNPDVSTSQRANNFINTSHLKEDGFEGNVCSVLPGSQLSVDQFIQKLPKSVLHNGQIVDVRNSIKDVLSNNPDHAAQATEIIQTEAIKEMKDSMNRPDSSRQVNVTTVRVKSENGSKTYILRMKFTDTIGDLRNYINKQRPFYRKPYDIISTFPKQIHSNSKKTLKDSGLVPNAALHLKIKK